MVMEINKELIESKRAEFPGCELARVKLKGKDEKSVVLEVLMRIPNRQIISEADKYESTNPGRAKEIYVRGCVLTDVETVLANDDLFYQAYFAVVDLLPFQKPDIERL